MNIFELAGRELLRENKDPNNMLMLLDRAEKIRKWLDRKHKIGKDILTGRGFRVLADRVKLI